MQGERRPGGGARGIVGQVRGYIAGFAAGAVHGMREVLRAM